MKCGFAVLAGLGWRGFAGCTVSVPPLVAVFCGAEFALPALRVDLEHFSAQQTVATLNRFAVFHLDWFPV